MSMTKKHPSSGAIMQSLEPHGSDVGQWANATDVI